jgi:hypothetical protein
MPKLRVTVTASAIIAGSFVQSIFDGSSSTVLVVMKLKGGSPPNATSESENRHVLSLSEPWGNERHHCDLDPAAIHGIMI